MVIENSQIFTWQKSDRNSEFFKKGKKGGLKGAGLIGGRSIEEFGGSGNDKH